MKYMEYEFYGTTYQLYVEIERYANNNNLAISLYTKDGEPFAMLTTNIKQFYSSDVACIDTNNLTNATELIDQYGLGEPTGEYVPSGYCIYPVYRFNIPKLLEYSKKHKTACNN